MMERLLTKLKSGEKTTIVALGDSITELTFHTRGRHNWCGYLQEALFEAYGRNRCWVINSGRSGETVAEGVKRLDEDVLRFDPDLVIVSYGINEARSPVSPKAFRNTLIRLIDRIRERRECEVLLRTPNPVVNPTTPTAPMRDQQAGMETAGTRVRLFARTIVGVAREKRCAVIDHYTLWKKAESTSDASVEKSSLLWLRMSDPVHPGPLGHLAFFREMAPFFEVARRFPWETDGHNTWTLQGP